jgi:parvulin-like peptidyl-prolyl isomerase
VGVVSATVKTKFGWHIIKLEDKKIATVAPFESLKQRIAQDIYNEYLKKHADELLKDVKIELVAVSSDNKEEEADKKEEITDKKDEKTEVKSKEEKKSKKDEKKKSEK